MSSWEVVGEMVGVELDGVDGLTICAMAERRRKAGVGGKAGSLRQAQGRLSPAPSAPVRNDKVVDSESSVRPVRNDGFTGKQLGEMAEAEFLARAAELGLGVACPWGDSNRYDFILDDEGRLCRVQVKSAHRKGTNGSYSIRTHKHSGEPYDASEIDALAAWVVPENAWYLFPVRVVRTLRTVKLFPGSRRKRSKFEKWREAWWVVSGRLRKML